MNGSAAQQGMAHGKFARRLVLLDDLGKIVDEPRLRHPCDLEVLDGRGRHFEIDEQRVGVVLRDVRLRQHVVLVHFGHLQDQGSQ